MCLLLGCYSFPLWSRTLDVIPVALPALFPLTFPVILPALHLVALPVLLPVLLLIALLAALLAALPVIISNFSFLKVGELIDFLF